MPNTDKIQLLKVALSTEASKRRDLAAVWAELLEAAETDPQVRAFIDRISGDGDLLFGVEPKSE